MTNFDPFAGGAIARTVDSTEAQREIWLAVRYGGAQTNLAYNESITLVLKGVIDVALLQRAAEALVSRHDALRSTFSANGETLVVNEDLRIDFSVIDLPQGGDHAVTVDSTEIRNQEVEHDFDLVNGPLVRFRLVRLSDQHAELIITAHHIICDGWSLGVIVNELDTLCQHGGEAGANLEPAPSFADHAIRDRKSLFGAEADAIERYWTGLLGKDLSELDLPTDTPRVEAMIELDDIPIRSVRASRYDHIINGEMTTRINEIARSSGAGLSALLLSVFAVYASRLSGQQDFVIGVPASAQAHTGQYGLVGHCVQMLPIRVQPVSEKPFPDFIKEIRKLLLDGFENQGLTFGTLLQRLRLVRDPSRVPLIPVMFNVDQEFGKENLDACSLDVISNPRVSENFEIFLNIIPRKGELIFEATYRTELFRETTLREWMEGYVAAIADVINEIDKPIEQIDCLSERQRVFQIETVNASAQNSWAGESTFLERFDNVVNQLPDRTAVQDAERSISYSDLSCSADQIAWTIRKAGIKPGSSVGICRSPGIEMVAGLLGIWKSGCAYIPLDPDYPEHRLRYVLKDTGTSLIFGQGSRPDFAGDIQWINNNHIETDSPVTDSLELPAPNPENLAYIIHTSGSTGDPKGVMVDHRAFFNFLRAMEREPGLTSEAVLVAVTSLSFDISTLEIFLPLSVGAKLVVADRDQARDGTALSTLIELSDATVLQATPSGWRNLLDAGWDGKAGLKALCGGEELPLSLATRLADKVGELWNMYGPTEATVWSTICKIPKKPISIPLGNPIDNTTVFVLDEKHKLLPPGASHGELYLGGAGLARGYLNRKDLTDAVFLPNPFENLREEMDETRLYKTGDRARINTNGVIQFFGRVDHQVKIRGFRVELGEIESVLTKAPEVSAAVVVLKHLEDGDDRIVAYVTPTQGNIPDASTLNTERLLQLVQTELPPQCAPQHIIILEHFPQTENGKIDRKALPDPILGEQAGRGKLATESQKKLGKLWCDLLRLDKIGSQDDFFLMGGHSMIAVRMLSRVREEFSLEIPLQAVFQDRNIAGLAARIDLMLMSALAAGNTPEENHEVIEF